MKRCHDGTHGLAVASSELAETHGARKTAGSMSGQNSLAMLKTPSLRSCAPLPRINIRLERRAPAIPQNFGEVEVPAPGVRSRDEQAAQRVPRAAKESSVSRSVIWRVLPRCSWLESFRQAIPDCLIDERVPEIVGINVCRNSGVVILASPRRWQPRFPQERTKDLCPP